MVVRCQFVLLYYLQYCIQWWYGACLNINYDLVWQSYLCFSEQSLTVYRISIQNITVPYHLSICLQWIECYFLQYKNSIYNTITQNILSHSPLFKCINIYPFLLVRNIFYAFFSLLYFDGFVTSNECWYISITLSPQYNVYDISSWCDYIKNYLPWSSLSNIKDYLPCTEICVNFKSLLFDSQFVHVHDMIKCYLKGHTSELNKIHLCRTTFFEKYKLGFPAWIIIKISCKIYVSCILLTA